MRSTRPSSIVLAFAALAAASSSIRAATIADWVVLGTPAANPATSGLNTDSPTFGSGTDKMDDVAVAGRFGTVGSPATVTLAVGDSLTISAMITLIGGSTTSNGDYRFGVFHDGGQFDADSTSTWTGGWVYSLGTAAQAGLFQGRTDGHFMSTSANAVNLTPTVSSSGTFNANTATSYTWTMTITRDSSTTVDLVTSFIGGPSSYSQTMTENNVNTTLFTYTCMGIYAGPNGNLDTLTVGSAQYTYSAIPEPRAALLGGLGCLVLLCRRRR